MPLIRMASYNIKTSQGMDGKMDIFRTAQVLETMKADCISLQEVDNHRPRSFFENQAGVIARILKMDYVFGAAINYKVGSFGNAILSKYPIIKSINHQLPASKPERSMLEVHLHINGQLLRVFNTHMELDRNLRLEQIRDFIVPLVMSSNSPAILSGDLNEGPDGLGITYLMNYFQDSFSVNSGTLTATFTADQPRERMDYILLNQTCAAVDYQIISSQASDHLPVMACIDF